MTSQLINCGFVRITHLPETDEECEFFLLEENRMNGELEYAAKLNTEEAVDVARFILQNTWARKTNMVRDWANVKEAGED